jgi:hypothetical protein
MIRKRLRKIVTSSPIFEIFSVDTTPCGFGDLCEDHDCTLCVFGERKKCCSCGATFFQRQLTEDPVTGEWTCDVCAGPYWQYAIAASASGG